MHIKSCMLKKIKLGRIFFFQNVKAQNHLLSLDTMLLIQANKASISLKNTYLNYLIYWIYTTNFMLCQKNFLKAS